MSEPLRAAKYFVNGLFALAMLVSLSGIFFLSLGFDEAWIISAPAGLATDGSIYFHGRSAAATTGGVYILFEWILFELFGTNILVARIFVYFCFLFLLREIFLFLAPHMPSLSARILVVAAFFGIPGTLILPVLALGVIPAFAVLISSLRLWNRYSNGTLNSRYPLILAALLLGLASSTRMQFVVIFPAFVIGNLLARKEAVYVKNILFVSILGFAVFLLTKIATFNFSAEVQETLSNAGGAIGITRLSLLDDAKLTRYFLVLNNLMPVSLIVTSTGIGLYLSQKNAELRPIIYTSLLFAWGIIFLWLLVSPHPHIRYVWPALAVFSLILGCAIAIGWQYSIDSNNHAVAFVISMVAASSILSGVVLSMRYISSGDSNNFHWELAGDMSLLERPESFTLAGGQKDMAAFISNLPPEDSVVFSIGLPAIELQFLADRKIYEYNKHEVPKNKQLYIVVGPDLGTYLQAPKDVAEWLRDNATSVAQFGRYSLFSTDCTKIPRFEIPRPRYFAPKIGGLPTVNGQLWRKLVFGQNGSDQIEQENRVQVAVVG